MGEKVLAAHLLNPAQREAGKDAQGKDAACPRRRARQPEGGQGGEPHGAAGVAGGKAMPGRPVGRNDVEQTQEGVVASVAVDAPRAVQRRNALQVVDHQRLEKSAECRDAKGGASCRGEETEGESEVHEGAGHQDEANPHQDVFDVAVHERGGEPGFVPWKALYCRVEIEIGEPQIKIGVLAKQENQHGAEGEANDRANQPVGRGCLGKAGQTRHVGLLGEWSRVCPGFLKASLMSAPFGRSDECRLAR